MTRQIRDWTDVRSYSDRDPASSIEDKPISQYASTYRHEFMMGGSYDRLGLLIEIREGIESMPKTASTFGLDQILDDDVHTSAVPDLLVELTGAWPLPQHFTSTAQKGRRWVNPNGTNPRYYSQVVTRCECGALMIRHQPKDPDPVVPGEHEHTADCPKDYRLHARARLHEKRRALVKRCAYLGHSIRSQSDRLGLSRDSLGAEAGELSLPGSTQMKEVSRSVLARTWADMADEHSPKRIARGYGCNYERVRKYINRRTDQSVQELKYKRNGETPKHD